MADIKGLQFEIKAKTDEGTRGIEALSKSLATLKNATKGGLGLNSSVKQLSKLNDVLKNFNPQKLESIGRALEAVGKAGEVKISGSLSKQLGSLVDVTKRIDWSDVEKLEAMATALRDLGEVSNVRLPRLNVPSTGVSPDLGTPAATPAGAATSGVGQANSQVQATTASVFRLKDVLSELSAVVGLGELVKPFVALKNVVSHIPTYLTHLKNILRDVYTSFKEGGGVIGMFGRALKSVAKNSASALGATMKTLTALLKNKFSPAVHKSAGKLGQFFASIKRIAVYRLIRFALSQLTKAFKEGVNNLYQYSQLMGGTFARSMDSLATSSAYLKNSLGAMVAPIINALAPAIDFLIGKIVTLLNYINMLFARLSGATTFTAAKKNAKSYGDSLAGAGGAASKAAKEIRDATTGIDELNIIMEKDDPSGGGGGGADYGSMFEELPIDNNISEFADKLKEAFNNADWQSLGTLLGEKINEMVDSVDWKGIGSKIGYYINGAIQTLYYFLDTIDFYNIAYKLSECFNGMLEQIDFTKLGGLIMKKFTIIGDLIIGAFEGIDWALVGKSLGNFFIGIFDEISKFIKKYDWGKLGKKLWQAIKDFIGNIDWAGLAKSMFYALGAALAACVLFIGEFFGSVWEDIKAYFSGKIEECGGDIPAGLWKGIKDGFGNVVKWIKDNVVDPFVEGFKEVFGIHSPSTVMEELGGYVTEGFLNGILAPFRTIGTWIDKNIVTPLREAFEKIDLVEFAVGVKNTAAEWWENVNTWWNRKVGEVQSFTTSVKNHASIWWSNVKTWWSGKVGAVKEFTTAVTNQSAEWWSNVKTWWSGKVGAVQQFTTSVKNEASTWWNNVKSWWSGKVGAVQQFTTSLKNDSLTWWNNCKSWWSGKVGEVQKFTTNVKNEASTWWSNVKTWWSGVVGTLMASVGIKNEAATWWSNVKSWWSNAVGTLWATLNIKLPKVVVTWKKDPIFGAVDLPSFSIQWNALGGILDGAQLFGMMGNTLLGGGEAGREAVLPLDSHTEWMDTLADKVRNGLPEGSDGTDYTTLKRALADFYTEYVQGTMTQIAADTNRQANKKEQTTVQIGNRAITDAVTTQQSANGYQFAT